MTITNSVVSSDQCGNLPKKAHLIEAYCWIFVGYTPFWILLGWCKVTLVIGISLLYIWIIKIQHEHHVFPKSTEWISTDHDFDRCPVFLHQRLPSLSLPRENLALMKTAEGNILEPWQRRSMGCLKWETPKSSENWSLCNGEPHSSG